MVKMGHHAVGVDSCIRASCPHSLDGGAQEGGQTLVEFLLDSDGIGLDLPSMVGRTVERQADKIAHGVGYGVVNVCDVVRVLLAKIGYLSLLNKTSGDFGVCGPGEWGLDGP